MFLMIFKFSWISPKFTGEPTVNLHHFYDLNLGFVKSLSKVVQSTLYAKRRKTPCLIHDHLRLFKFPVFVMVVRVCVDF